jgi:hypothetical protein
LGGRAAYVVLRSSIPWLALRFAPSADGPGNALEAAEEFHD